MEISIGVMPNCSEVVMPLIGISYERLVDVMTKLGMEFITKREEDVGRRLVGLDAEAMIAEDEERVRNGEESSGWKVFFETPDRISDSKNPSLPDKEYSASMWLGKLPTDLQFVDQDYDCGRTDCNRYSKCFDGDEWDTPQQHLNALKCEFYPRALWYHQHSQPQGYPTILKLARVLHVLPEGFDGGYSFEALFTAWMVGLNASEIPHYSRFDHDGEVQEVFRGLVFGTMDIDEAKKKLGLLGTHEAEWHKNMMKNLDELTNLLMEAK